MEQFSGIQPWQWATCDEQFARNHFLGAAKISKTGPDGNCATDF
jgi:hypothetical protein